PTLKVSSDISSTIGERFNCCPRPWVVLGIGALHAEREWPHEYWVKLLSELRPHSGGAFFFFGGGGYTARAQSIIAQSKLSRAINACHLSLVEAIALLDHADLFVGTDSGPMNLAVAVGTPSFVMFGVNPVLSYSKFIHPLTPPGGPAP